MVFLLSISLRLAAIAAFRSSSSASCALRVTVGCTTGFTGSDLGAAGRASTPDRVASSKDIWRANFKSLSSSSSTRALLGYIDLLDWVVGEEAGAMLRDFTFFGLFLS